MYDQIARYYDLVHDQLEDDVAFVKGLASDVDGRILELGCGSGRLLLPLAEAGHTVVGVDNAPNMLARARRRIAGLPAQAQQRVTLVQSDLRELELPSASLPMSMAVFGYNTFLHFQATEAGSLLRRLRDVLVDDALIYIDIVNPFMLADAADDRALRLEHTLLDSETGQVIQQFSSSWHAPEAQTLHVTWLFVAMPPGGGAVQRAVVEHAYHYQHPHELELQLARAGFQVANWFGDYDASPFVEESERLLVLARPK